MKRGQTFIPLRNQAWPIAAAGFTRRTGASIATASKFGPITFPRISIVSAMPARRLVRNGLNAGAPRAIMFLSGRLRLDRSEWGPMWRAWAKLRQLKKKSRQQRRLQALLRIRLRLRNLRLRTRARLNREPVVLRPHRQLLLRRRQVLLRPPPPLLRIHHQSLRLHRIQWAYRRLIRRPGIIDIFIRRAA